MNTIDIEMENKRKGVVNGPRKYPHPLTVDEKNSLPNDGKIILPRALLPSDNFIATLP